MSQAIKIKISRDDQYRRQYNRRSGTASLIIHALLFLLYFPRIEKIEEAKKEEEKKLIPITMELVQSNKKVKNLVAPSKVAEADAQKAEITKKAKSGTDRAFKNADRLGNPLKDKVQDVQKGDPMSRKKTAYVPGTDLRKLPKNQIGSGAAKTKTPGDGVGGGTGDTYKGTDFTNLTGSLLAKGQGLKRYKGTKGGIDDGGAGNGTGGGIGDGVGGGSGNGFITGSTNGTPNLAKVATNVGSLTGAAKGKIDSSRGFEGLAEKGSVMVAGVPAEKIAIPPIDGDTIRRILREHQAQFKFCYQKELKDSGDADRVVQGRIDMSFIIARPGNVTQSQVLSSTIDSDNVRSCIKNVLHGIRFPQLKGDAQAVQVRQPMNLYANER